MATAEEKFLQELISSARNQADRGRSIDGKAVSMITISATATSLLIGFASSLFGLLIGTHTDPVSGIETRPVIIVLLIIIGLVLTISSTFIFLSSSNPKRYRYAMTHYVFFKADGGIDEQMVKRFREAPADTFDDTMIHDYLITIRSNFQTNQKREKIIFIGQSVFVANIITILFAIMLEFLSFLRS